MNFKFEESIWQFREGALLIPSDLKFTPYAKNLQLLKTEKRSTFYKKYLQIKRNFPTREF